MSPAPAVKYLEVDRHYNYHIPTVAEVASKKQELMAGKKFKDKAKKVGQQQAERDLDTELTHDVNYLKEKNKLGSEKIPLIEIGAHSAYVSKYTYRYDSDFNNCTGDIEDPTNLLFYDTAKLGAVAGLMMTYGGWEVSPYTEPPLKEDDQCAYTSSSYPWNGSIYNSDFKTNQLHMIKEYSNPRGGIEERDHMRMWDGGYSPDSMGYWTLGAAHHEWVDTSYNTLPHHCLNPYEPEGSSFDYAEGQVWNVALGRFGHFFYDAQNKFKPDGSSWNSCGNTVNHDGRGVGIDIPSDILNPGEELAPGQYRLSPDRRFWLTYQTDGNLVLYQRGVGPLWASNTITSPGYAAMQTDGNFVLYWPSWVPYWATNTAGNPGAYLAVQNDGNVVIYRSNGTWMWQTGTCCR